MQKLYVNSFLIYICTVGAWPQPVWNIRGTVERLFVCSLPSRVFIFCMSKEFKFPICSHCIQYLVSRIVWSFVRSISIWLDFGLVCSCPCPLCTDFDVNCWMLWLFLLNIFTTSKPFRNLRDNIRTGVPAPTGCWAIILLSLCHSTHRIYICVLLFAWHQSVKCYKWVMIFEWPSQLVSTLCTSICAIWLAFFFFSLALDERFDMVFL